MGLKRPAHPAKMTWLERSWEPPRRRFNCISFTASSGSLHSHFPSRSSAFSANQHRLSELWDSTSRSQMTRQNHDDLRPPKSRFGGFLSRATRFSLLFPMNPPRRIGFLGITWLGTENRGCTTGILDDISFTDCLFAWVNLNQPPSSPPSPPRSLVSLC